MPSQDAQPDPQPQPITRNRLAVVGFTGMGILLLISVVAVAAGRLLLGGSQVALVEVREGAFRPGIVEARAGEPLRLRVVVRDRQACPERLEVGQLGVALTLPPNGAGELAIPASKPGTYAIACGEGLPAGTLRLR